MQIAAPVPRRDIIVVALPGTLMSSIGAFLDCFAQVAQRVTDSFAPPFRVSMESKVRVFSTTNDLIELSSRSTLSADGNIHSGGRFQAIYIAAFAASNEDSIIDLLRRQGPLSQWLCAQHAAGAIIGAAGNGVCVLAEAGLLDHSNAPIPREWTALFRRQYPRIRHERRHAVVEYQRVLTCATPANEWHLLVRLAEYVTTADTARWLAAKLGLSRGRENTSLVTEDPIVAAAQYWLEERFTQPFAIADLARETGVSHSTLLRRFHSALATTPRAYALRLRMDSAKSMLMRTNRSIDQISAMLGYSDTRSFRVAFRASVHLSPTKYRLKAKK